MQIQEVNQHKINFTYIYIHACTPMVYNARVANGLQYLWDNAKWSQKRNTV